MTNTGHVQFVAECLKTVPEANQAQLVILMPCFVSKVLDINATFLVSTSKPLNTHPKGAAL